MALSNKAVISISPPQSIPITLTNNQSVSAPAGLQVMIQLSASNLTQFFGTYTTSSLVAGGFGNIRFLYNGSLIPAWFESINNGVATFWVKIPTEIPANSSIGLEMAYSTKYGYDGVYLGMAPQLSPTYGEYDNGASVFNNYWNFAGTGLPSGLVCINATCTINNGATIGGFTGAGGTFGGLATTASFGINTVMDAYGSFEFYGAGYTSILGFSDSIGSSSLTGFAYILSNGYGQSITSGAGTTYTTTDYTSQTLGVYTVFQTATNAYSNFNYASPYSVSASLSGTMPIAILYQAGEPSSTIQWLRIRAYPPNGVMPTVTIGD